MFPLSLSADGRVLAWKLNPEGGSSKIVVDGVEGQAYASTGVPVLSNDGTVVAYRAADAEGRWFVVVGGKRVSASFELVTDPAVSRDGEVVAYAGEGDPNVLVVDEKKIDLPEFPRSVFLSQNGHAWGYLTRSSVVTAGWKSEAFDEIGSAEFDSKGDRVAFSARTGKAWFVVIGTHKWDAPGLVYGPHWSSDGRQIGYGALLGREIWWKTIAVE